MIPKRKESEARGTLAPETVNFSAIALGNITAHNLLHLRALGINKYQLAISIGRAVCRRGTVSPGATSRRSPTDACANDVDVLTRRDPTPITTSTKYFQPSHPDRKRSN